MYVYGRLRQFSNLHEKSLGFAVSPQNNEFEKKKKKKKKFVLRKLSWPNIFGVYCNLLTLW